MSDAPAPAPSPASIDPASRAGQITQEALLVNILARIDEVKAIAQGSADKSERAAASAADAARSAQDAANHVLEFGKRLELAEAISRRAVDDATDAKRLATETESKVTTDLGAAATHLAKIGEAASAVTAAGDAIAKPIEAIQKQNDGQTEILAKLSTRVRNLAIAMTIAAPAIGTAAAAIYTAFMQARGH